MWIGNRLLTVDHGERSPAEVMELIQRRVLEQGRRAMVQPSWLLAVTSHRQKVSSAVSSVPKVALIRRAAEGVR
ncbi:hypothetical protein GCM10010252_30130 [Streptomyces aureoverticillatus]|nr:hypothetical protein GCM10010252_30130 [Streptomyces aureoverticillatus]